MAYIEIDGYELPPCKRGVKIVTTTLVNSGRNANGAVVGQKIGRDQYKIDGLEWSVLDDVTWENILSKLDKFFVMVTFNDPVTNAKKTIQMYCGDRSGEPYYVDETGKPTLYRNCKVNLIDTGR